MPTVREAPAHRWNASGAVLATCANCWVWLATWMVARVMAASAVVTPAAAALSAMRARREKAASRAFAASISRLSRPKPRDPASPTPSSSARTCRPPTAARRTLTLFSAMGLIHLFVEFGHHHRFNDGQHFGHGERRHAERVTESQRR